MIGKVLLRAEKQLKIEKCIKRNGGVMKVCTWSCTVLSSRVDISKYSTNGVVVT